jgi:hypothetical protein
MVFACLVSVEISRKTIFFSKSHSLFLFKAAPFCYLYDTPVALYFTFRAFYIRYCHRLTTVNTHSQGIVSLCLLYEKLLQTHEPHLWSHLRELQIQP